MDIIISLSALDIDVNLQDMEKARNEIFKAILQEYEDSATDKEISLSSYWNENNFLFGITDSERLIQRVLGWKNEIQAEFIRCLRVVCPNGKIPEPGELQIDSTATYQLVCATRELDNTWFDNAEHAVYIENEHGYPYFKVLLQDSEIEDIKEHPENYVILTVFIK